MSSKNAYRDELGLDDGRFPGGRPRVRGISEKEFKTKGKPPTRPKPSADETVSAQFDNLRAYQFSYQAARHEEWWLLDALGPFFDEQWFDDVLRMVKGGKEASVYLCRANSSASQPLLAAKVYRPRALRNLRKDHLYREGRAQLDADGLEIVDARMARAMQKRSDFGKRLMHTSWIEHEYRTLKKLHAAGCDVPQAYASAHNAILMDFIGDEEMGAPTLHGHRLARAQAQRLWERLRHNLDLMLAERRVHGDLSDFNILYWEQQIWLIDFPQAIDPLENPNAYRIFQRDLQRVCDYFNHQGLRLDPQQIAQDLWLKHGYEPTQNILWLEEDFGDADIGDADIGDADIGAKEDFGDAEV